MNNKNVLILLLLLCQIITVLYFFYNEIKNPSYFIAWNYSPEDIKNLGDKTEEIFIKNNINEDDKKYFLQTHKVILASVKSSNFQTEHIIRVNIVMFNFFIFQTICILIYLIIERNAERKREVNSTRRKEGGGGRPSTIQLALCLNYISIEKCIEQHELMNLVSVGIN
jgi:hypothetical protein